MADNALITDKSLTPFVSRLVEEPIASTLKRRPGDRTLRAIVRAVFAGRPTSVPLNSCCAAVSRYYYEFICLLTMQMLCVLSFQVGTWALGHLRASASRGAPPPWGGLDPGLSEMRARPTCVVGSWVNACGDFPLSGGSFTSQAR